MSQEWLKQRPAVGRQDLRKRAQQMQKAQPSSVRQTAGRQRSLVGAAFGFFFRWLFLFALVEAVAMFVVADSQGLSNESWGYIFHYVVWYALPQPIFPDELYVGLQDWFGLTPAVLSHVYDQVNPFIQDNQDALVYYVPAGAALALTLFFLPATNAKRRRSPIRFLVFLANLAVIFLYKQLGQAVIALWLGALLFSFAGGGGLRVPRQSRPQVATPQPQQRQAARRSRQPASHSGRPRTRRVLASVVVDLSSRTPPPSTSASPPWSGTVPAPGSAGASAAPRQPVAGGTRRLLSGPFTALSRPLTC
jgi:hypothetical protein